jgi:CRISPR-associated protein Cas5h
MANETKGPLLIFDLVGPMAHFRKFYTNSSSLSYPFPPRTAIMGVIAALLGRERDTYYKELALENARIGIALKTPFRSVMQTVNYLATDRDNQDWHGAQRRIQIPLELILPRPPARFLRYRIFFSSRKPDLLEELYERLSQGQYRYPLYLGLTECPAWAENPCLLPEVNLVSDPKEPLPVETVVPLPKLGELPDLQELRGLRLLKDRIPLDFYPDRKLKAAADVVWEAEGRALPLKLKGEVFPIPEDSTYGCFLEP